MHSEAAVKARYTRTQGQYLAFIYYYSKRQPRTNPHHAIARGASGFGVRGRRVEFDETRIGPPPIGQRNGAADKSGER